MTTRMNSADDDYSAALSISSEVQSALSQGRAVVALESTIISHGLPYPENLQTAKGLEDTIRSNGATPATIAVINGIPHVGLTSAQLQVIARPDLKTVYKLALRDLPLAYAESRHGATTVSATMHLAHRAGIHVFATGGIGGVHRRVEYTWDISADIPALSRFPVLVVCAGAKAILDIPKTLEALETASVPVFTLNENEFPAFYTRNSGSKSPAVVNGVKDAALVFREVRSCLKSGALLAVPLPKEAEPDVKGVQKAIDIALDEVSKKQTNGDIAPPQVTPFLLRRVAELTKGASLRANMSLVKHNAATAARISVELSKILQESSKIYPGYQASRTTTISSSSSSSVSSHLNTSFSNQIQNGTVAEPYNERSVQVIVVGATVLDVVAKPKSDETHTTEKSTLKGAINIQAGGVGLNVAKAVSRFSEARVKFFSAIGDDLAGRTLSSLLHLQLSKKRRLSHSMTTNNNPNNSDKAVELFTPTIRGRQGAVISIIHNEEGDLKAGIADTDRLFGDEKATLFSHWQMELRNNLMLQCVRVVIVDANLCISDIRNVVHAARIHKADIWLEPTSVAKCNRFIEADVLWQARYISPNEAELIKIGDGIKIGQQQRRTSNGTLIEDEVQINQTTEIILSATRSRNSKQKQSLFVTRGSLGVSKFCIAENNEVERKDFAAKKVPKLVNTTGAGDCFAGCCAGWIATGTMNEDSAIELGISAAAASCASAECVPPSPSAENGRVLAKL